MRRLAAFCLVAVLTALPGLGTAADDLPPSFDEMIKLLKMDPSVKDQALGGEIVVLDPDDSVESELAIALVMVVKQPYATVIDAVQNNRLFQFQKDTLDFAQIEGEADVSQFQKVGYTMDEVDEVRSLMAVKPGSNFNLSAEEIAKYQALQAKAGGMNDAALVESVNKQIRETLAERLAAYQKTGLKGIADYQRSPKKSTSPAEAIAAANAAVADMKRFAPNFYGLLENFPNAKVEGVDHRFFVFKLNIEGRPGFVLSHRIYFYGAEFTLAAERHIYAPHFYNSLQLVAGAIPHENNTVIFYGNRTYTDQVTGFGQGMKHSIGGKQLTKTVKSMLADMRKGLESGQASQ